MLVLFVALAGCGPDRSRQQAVALYFWNQTDEAMGYFVDPQTDPPSLGSIQTGVTSAGCGWLPNPWTISITQEPAHPDRRENLVRDRVVIHDRQARSASVWIRIAPNGTIETGAGVPEWWETDVQVCPTA